MPVKSMNPVDPKAINKLKIYRTRYRRDLSKILRREQLKILKSVPNGNTSLLDRDQRGLLFTIETVMQAIGTPTNYWV